MNFERKIATYRWLWLGPLVAVIYSFCVGSTKWVADAAFVLLFAAFGLLGSVHSYFFPHQTEISRVSSPDQAVDAVMIRTNPPFVTLSPFYELYVVAAGAKEFGKYDRIVEGSALEEAHLRWIAPHLLELDYDDSCLNNFRNWWCRDGTAHGCPNDPYSVEIRLISPTDQREHGCKSD